MNRATSPKGQTTTQSIHPQLSGQEIVRLKKEFARTELDAREFFFKKAVNAYLDEQLLVQNLFYSIQGIMPAMSKQEIHDFLKKLETDKVGLNGSRDFYLNEMWANFTLAGKNLRT